MRAKRATQQQALVVEDDDAIREVLRDLLEEDGYGVQDAADGVEALAILRRDTRGLVVVLDNLLPGMNGAEVLAALEDDDGVEGSAIVARSPRTVARHAFVLITASPQRVSPALQERLARLGAQIITKPFDIATLRLAVSKAAQRLAP